MSKLILKMSMSLDGYVADAEGDNSFIFSTFSDDATAWTLDTLGHTAAHLMGSSTYRDMAAHWPESESVFAAPMNDLPKVVFSQTMTTAEWGDTRILAGHLDADVAKLKEEGSDAYLLAHGGARFAQSLVRTGLIDRVPAPRAPGGAGQRHADLPRPDGAGADRHDGVQPRRGRARLSSCRLGRRKGAAPARPRSRRVRPPVQSGPR